MKQKINTPQGVYTYTFHPLFAGIKPIDKAIARENLFILKDVCDEANLKFILFYGTLLGAVREKDFITHDEDIDIVMRKEDKDAFLSMLFRLRELGFEVAREDERGILSIIRKGEYIDIYWYETYLPDQRLKFCSRNICKRDYIDDLTQLEFHGRPFYVPREYVAFLEYYYGKNWQTPVKQFDFKMSKWKLCKLYVLAYLKLLLPKWMIGRALNGKTERERAVWLNHLYEVETF
ncbi:MAG: LicD family protein [Bacteroidaceae bacterium]|nr:LicD family protein [Bacteroidaceae bacterium]